jgi:hypothetical protein
MAIKGNKLFAVCIDNSGYEVSLEKRKIYEITPESEGRVERIQNMLRVVDESGEDYLYPRRMFVELELPPQAEEAFASVA